MTILQSELFLDVMTPERVALDLTGRTCAGTGHRPPKLGGYDEAVYARLVAFTRRWVDALQPKLVISGAALGFDFALADAAIAAGVPLHLAIPCDTQASKWPPASQRKYDWLRCARHVRESRLPRPLQARRDGPAESVYGRLRRARAGSDPRFVGPLSGRHA